MITKYVSHYTVPSIGFTKISQYFLYVNMLSQEGFVIDIQNPVKVFIIIICVWFHLNLLVSFCSFFILLFACEMCSIFNITWLNRGGQVPHTKLINKKKKIKKLLKNGQVNSEPWPVNFQIHWSHGK